MPEYIEREVAIKELMNDAPEQVGYSREDASGCIRYIDAADVAPVRHAKWIPCENGGYYCSYCDKRVAFAFDNNYCPNCGAKMDGGKTDA